ncbi:Protein of unknown function [Flavobacterium indicum GPTSA100-9 = DSM 17447]|uniref:Lipocalin-like domain-containing protein n=1 Tax=Flavobacterium indicum (strain DSM 17447 / CIP 109464 / GPTSA100-9) TaxID=1094466 RepID=H8XUW1_FLAIG|nr:hypothetical protein [Flavobacterium indicum]CCG53889.1 Protein of unknown function [Flavobacterium indicum GPTSA100-9 = DSM 17447]
MKKIIALGFVFILISCQSKPQEKDLPKMNGYWEIEEVEFPDGNKKVYQVNELIDLFELKNNKGFRTKVKAQLDGSFIKSEMKDAVEIVDSNDVVYLKTKSKYSKMVEKILKINDKELVIENETKIVYHYKKFIPYSKR